MGPRAKQGALIASMFLIAPLAGGCLGGDDDEGGGNGGGSKPIPRGEARAGAPNLVVVMTDDQTVAGFTPEHMPRSWRIFAEGGTVFERSYATPPLCCPARASFITGQYPSSNGIAATHPGYQALTDRESTLGGWLQRAGYRTALAGKFLHGHEGDAKPAPGWDSWSVFLRAPSYFDYELSLDGEVEAYGAGPADYSTDVLTDRAVEFVRSSARSRRPFFLWLAYNAPHIAPGGEGECTGRPQPPEQERYERFRDEELPRTPAFDEADVEDKPGFVRRDPPISAARVTALTEHWRCGLATLAEVDRGLERLVGAIRQAGELEDTVLVFTSDNGYFFGEHRQFDNKRLPYPASARVPLAIAAPARLLAGAQVPRVDEPVGTVDLAPTLLDFAGGRPCARGDCRELDGLSLRGLLAGDRSEWPRDRALLLELNDGYAYRAVVTGRYRYARYTATYNGPLDSPEEELYDLQDDPHELANLLRTDPRRARPIAARLATVGEDLAGGRPPP